MEYTILILLLPVLSFLVLALAGMKMSHRAAGLIGSLSLGAVAVLCHGIRLFHLAALGRRDVRNPDTL